MLKVVLAIGAALPLFSCWAIWRFGGFGVRVEQASDESRYCPTISGEEQKELCKVDEGERAVVWVAATGDPDSEAKPCEATGTFWVMRCYVESLAIYPVAAHRSTDYEHRAQGRRRFRHPRR